MLQCVRLGAAAVACLLVAGTGYGQTVDEVIAKNLRARGGVEKLKALNSAKITGNVVQEGGSTLRIVTWAKRPNMMRREMEPVAPAGGTSVARGSMPLRDPSLMKAVIAFDGTTVWAINPALGPGARPMTGPGADMDKDNADFDSVFLDYKARGHKVELMGTEPIAGKPTHHLRITKKTGQVQHYYLDVDTGLEVRTGATVEQGGQKSEVTTDLSNYQTVEGLTIPFSMRQAVDGKTVAQVTIERFEVNVPIADQIFKMPGRN